jgi:hypothetical protein
MSHTYKESGLIKQRMMIHCGATSSLNGGIPSLGTNNYRPKPKQSIISKDQCRWCNHYPCRGKCKLEVPPSQVKPIPI